MPFRRIGRSIGRAFRRAVKFGKNVIGAVSKPLSIAKKVINKVGGILEKLPGGKLLTGFAKQFLNNPLSLLSTATLGPIGAILNFAKNPGSLANLVSTLVGTVAGKNPQGLNNVLNMTAARHAQMLFRR
ncbi:MAG: hypothetical protein AAFN74_17305 [Myxococcota bacterium]